MRPKWNHKDINQQWTLFLDRDGVINEKLDGDYVKQISEFNFIEGSVEAIRKMNEIFGITVVVTNQQGIGKGLMTEDDLSVIHHHMLSELALEGAKIDKVYHCPDLAEKNSNCRKPNTGMAEEARKDFPTIDFKSSIMVGDSISDLQMGKRVGMITVYIHPDEELPKEADYVCRNLEELANILVQST
ncbi:gmhB [Symbiodinium microadriaticum]|nr:gmhB [Symbiodinium microadriaticum]